MLHSSTLISKPQDDEFGEIFHHTLNRRPGIGRMNGPEARSGNRLDLIRADTLEPESVNWLWLGWLAVGKFHLLAGRAGTGKTTLALKIGATISSGQSWPDGAPSQTGDVVIWSGEDGVQDTLLPRLLAAGADPRRVHFVSTVTDEPVLTDAPIKGTLATEWLRTMLADGSRCVDQVKAAAEADGHSWRTVERAKRTLGVVANKASMNGGWEWQLPKAAT